MTKQEIRQEMRIRRDGMSDLERERRDAEILNCLLGMEEIKNAAALFSFVSHGSEADTLGLISLFLQWEKTVAVPRVDGKDMDFYRITGLEQLRSGYRGIQEPVSSCLQRAENGVMLMPGLAFDMEKNRVGYGGGYYDRYLEKKVGERLFVLAVCYDFQVVDAIPADAYDRRPDAVVTDRRVIW